LLAKQQDEWRALLKHKTWFGRAGTDTRDSETSRALLCLNNQGAGTLISYMSDYVCGKELHLLSPENRLNFRFV